MNATLDVGAVSDTVTIVAEAQRIQSETATVGALVEEAQVKNMMLNGRNPVLLAALKPGVRSNASLANFNFNLTDGGFSMNGSRPNDNVFFYDGAVATRTRSNGTSIGANGSGQFGIPPSPQGQPNGNPTSSTFGKVTTKDSRRQLQLSLKYTFSYEATLSSGTLSPAVFFFR